MNNVSHNAKGFRNRYCGPAALSAIAGITAEEAAALLRHVSGKRAIMGVHDRYMMMAFKALGLTATKTRVSAKTISKWRGRGSGKYLVVAGGSNGHYIAVEGKTFWDSGAWKGSEGATLKSIGRRMIKKVWVITGRVNKQVIRDITKTKAKATKKRVSVKAKTLALCAELNCQISHCRDEIVVDAPTGYSMGCDGSIHSIYAWCDNYDNTTEMWEDIFHRISYGVDECGCEDHCQYELEQAKKEVA